MTKIHILSKVIYGHKKYINYSFLAFITKVTGNIFAFIISYFSLLDNKNKSLAGIFDIFR